MIQAILNFFQALFSPVVDVFSTVLLYFHQNLGAPWWLSIVMLTVIVRSLLFPLTVKQVKSMRAMQDLKPEMDKVRAQYRDNVQRQREEMAKVYQERGVNPLGGCLPILVQMPIFIGIFYVIRHLGGDPNAKPPIPPEEPSFVTGGILWFQDLSQADPTYLLPIISAVTMLAATEITSKNIDPQQRWLMRLLPIGFTAFLLYFPAGLFVYWITSNLVTLVQNYVIYNHGPGKRTLDDGKAASRGKSAARSVADNRSDSRANGRGASQFKAEDPAERAAKADKRKRRKKKK
jgi:YidC/Oxa1 family membrane protein insertase